MSKHACRKVFSQTLLSLGREHSNIVAVTSDARGSVTIGDFAAQLPQQFVECGIAEQNEVGVAAGLASCGKTVFVCAPAPFLSARSYEQVKIDVAYNHTDVKIIGVSGGVSYGTLGYTHHALQDISAMRAVVGLPVIIPSDGRMTAALTELLAATAGPFYVRLGRGDVEDIYTELDSFELGRAKQLRDGSELTIVACGEMVAPAAAAAALLADKGVDVRVLDMFCIKPLDTDALTRAARETGAILTVEEHSIYGGLGSAVCECVCAEYPVPVDIMGFPDTHVIAGEVPQVFEHYGFTAGGIAERALALLNRKKELARK